MPAILFTQRIGSSLVAATNADLEAIEALPFGEVMKTTLAENRTNTAHAFYFELCRRVAEMLQACGDDTATKETVDIRFRVATGHYALIPLSLKAQAETGCKLAVRERSISFEKLDRAGMRRFLDRVVSFTLSELLPHVPARELRKEVESLLDEDERKRRREAA